MNDPKGNKAFDPSNIIFEIDKDNNVKMFGYFKQNTVQVDDSFILYVSHYVPTKQEFSYDDNNATISTSPLHILYNNIYRRVETPKLGYNLVKVSSVSDLHNLLLNDVNK